jgi:DNA-binding NarL/FixJ family response regulator
MLGTGKPAGPSTLSARILVVDDFGPWRLLTCWRLEANKQFQVVGEAEDGLDAIRKAQELKPDVVLMDIGLPSLNGIEVARWIGKLVPRAEILFLTQHNDAGMMRAALSSGARGYVLKADAETELLPAIEAVLRGEKFVSIRLRTALPGTESSSLVVTDNARMT